MAVAGVRSAADEPDGKRNDVCPRFFDVGVPVLTGGGTVEVTGPYAVSNLPETVTVAARVRGETGGHAGMAVTFERSDSDGPARRPRWLRRSGVATGSRSERRLTSTPGPDDSLHIVFRWESSRTLNAA
jgi:hypothetical protein